VRRYDQRDHRGDLIGPAPLGFWALVGLGTWAAIALVAGLVVLVLWLAGAI
jgi:hypothetical protein